jgi:hypothetical protein
MSALLVSLESLAEFWIVWGRSAFALGYSCLFVALRYTGYLPLAGHSCPSPTLGHSCPFPTPGYTGYVTVSVIDMSILADYP